MVEPLAGINSTRWVNDEDALVIVIVTADPTFTLDAERVKLDARGIVAGAVTVNHDDVTGQPPVAVPVPFAIAPLIWIVGGFPSALWLIVRCVQLISVRVEPEATAGMACVLP
jgi:hypothetical protein